MDAAAVRIHKGKKSSPKEQQITGGIDVPSFEMYVVYNDVATVNTVPQVYQMRSSLYTLRGRVPRRPFAACP